MRPRPRRPQCKRHRERLAFPLQISGDTFPSQNQTGEGFLPKFVLGSAARRMDRAWRKGLETVHGGVPRVVWLSCNCPERDGWPDGCPDGCPHGCPDFCPDNCPDASSSYDDEETHLGIGSGSCENNVPRQLWGTDPVPRCILPLFLAPPQGAMLIANVGSRRPLPQICHRLSATLYTAALPRAPQGR